MGYGHGPPAPPRNSICNTARKFVFLNRMHVMCTHTKKNERTTHLDSLILYIHEYSLILPSSLILYRGGMHPTYL